MKQAVHSVPLNDTRQHATDDALCPCMPRALLDGSLIVHNSYDGREVGRVCHDALDVLAMALVSHKHQWSVLERTSYERAMDLIHMHWDIPIEGDDG